MSRTRGNGFYHSITRQIRRSRKAVTILFTDVEGSTRHWDSRGDVEGRLMIDLHNRLVYPVIKRHRGKIIKTIGDAIMASFKSPENGLRASIGIQQILDRRRKEDKTFRLKVRIGVHTGQALVEHKDVFGDTVNVAARMESYGKGNEICVSGGTASKVGKKAFGLVRKGAFVPKGKRKAVTIYKCQWKQYPSLIDGIKEGGFLPVVMRQKFEIFVYSLASLGILYFLFLKYVRYVFVDAESLALLALNPQLILDIHIGIPIGLGAVAVASLLLLTRMKTIPHVALSLLKGGFGFALAFLLFFVPTDYFHFDFSPTLKQNLYQSHHLFVKVLEDVTGVRQAPAKNAPIIRTVNKGNILLLADVAVRGGVTWNKVLVDKRKYGWIPRIVPAKIGVPKTRLTIAHKFYFRYRDLYALIAGVMGFMWGTLSFRIRPA
jgi:class 3 adenylate cyclase